MNDNNQEFFCNSKKLITLVCFLCYFFTGVVILSPGPLFNNFSEVLNIGVTELGFIYSIQNIGLLVAMIVVGFLLHYTKIRNIFYFVFICMAIIITIFSLKLNNLFVFKSMLFLLGALAGTTMTLGSYMIAHISSPRQRGRNIIFVDFFFSFSGFAIGFLISNVFVYIGSNLYLYTYYALAIVACLMLVTLFRINSFDTFFNNKDVGKGIHATNESWIRSPSIILISIAAFLFILSQMVYVYYLPQHFEKDLLWTIQQSNRVMTIFWASQGIFLFLSPLVTSRLRIDRLLLLFIFLVLIFFSIVTFTDVTTIVYISIFIMGAFNCMVYSGMLAFSTLQVKISSASIVSFVLTCGAIGTATSGYFGAQIYRIFGSFQFCLISSLILIIVCFVLVVVSVKLSPMLKYHKL